MNKVVVNKCYGGFGLSDLAQKRYTELTGNLINPHLRVLLGDYIPRHDPALVQVVEELGEKASGSFANLEVVTVPSDRYRICEYDGMEWVETPDSIDWIEL